MTGLDDSDPRRSLDSGPGGSVGRRLIWLILGLALGLGLVTLLARGRPARGFRVVETRPSAGGQVGALGPVQVRFSEPLAEALAAGSVVLDGQAARQVSVDGDQLRITPPRPLDRGEEHRVELAGTLLAASGQSLRATYSLSFSVRPAEVAYLRQGPHGRELVRSADAGALTLSGDHDVTGFASDRMGETLVYSARNPQGGEDLWLVDREGANRRSLLGCGRDRCQNPNWSPDGERLAFVRQERGDGQAGVARIWTIAVESQAAAPLYQDPSRRGLHPVWSPNGLWLAYYDPGVNGIRLLDLDTVSEEVLPTGTGVSGAWSPGGESLLFPVMEFEGQTPLTALYQLDLASREVTPVLRRDAGWRQVAVPAWSPTGGWIALAAQRSGAGPTATMWRMRPDGRAAERVAGQPQFVYGGPDWDPWGRRLLFQRLAVGGSDDLPDLLLWSAAGGAEVHLQAAGAGEWLP